MRVAIVGSHFTEFEVQSQTDPLEYRVNQYLQHVNDLKTGNCYPQVQRNLLTPLPHE